jgi:uncharacterized protein (DUF433 family)
VASARTVQKSLRIRCETQEAIEALASEAGIDFSAAANQLLEEAVRARRCPGIVFTSGAGGRRATIAGTGLDVWEVVSTYRGLGRSAQRLQRAYHWLTEPQLRAALAYAELYPDEIERRIEQNTAWTPATLRTRHPALIPNAAPARRRAR